MIEHIVIPTKNRPDVLERCIASVRFAFPTVSITVIDGSDDDVTSFLCSTLPVTYIGPNEVAALVDELAAKHGHRELWAFAFASPGIGAARNVAVWLNRGRKFVMMDDDAEARFCSVPPGLPSPLPDPTSWHFYKSRADALAHAQWITPNLLADADAQLQKGVVATQCGLLGDCAMEGTAYVSRVSPAYSREVLRGVPDQVETNLSGHFMTVCSAFDGAHRLPPFYPTGRNEDGLFGYMTILLGQKLGHLPYAILHNPEESRAFGSSDARATDTLMQSLGYLWPGGTMASMGNWLAGNYGNLIVLWDRVYYTK